MFGGDDDDGAGLFQQLAGGLTGAAASANWAHRFRPQPRAYDEYLKAYSMAMLPGRERENVSYGGKIIMPPSALARLSSLELESPWQFQLRNPQNPAASTHCGVLEFIADEGVVHLPQWMMKTLRLNEGDMIRITGAQLPKGKFVKLQAQSVDFLEVSDPKAVLEQALRNFSTLTQGDIIEIIYNRIVFGMLIMEIKPEGAGISIFETDLEVDFAPPVGYVEPVRPTPAPPATMASKLKIDLSSATPGSSRPGSALAGSAPGPSGDWESFKGRGETLNGRKTKGKGKSVRKIEGLAEGSRIYRTDKARTVTTDDLDTDVKVPAPLNVPFGKLFFGYNYVPYKPDETSTGGSSTTSPPPVPVVPTFGGSGNTLSGKAPRSTPSSAAKGKSRAVEEPVPAWASSGGKALGSKKKVISVHSDEEYDDDVIDIDSD